MKNLSEHKQDLVIMTAARISIVASKICDKVAEYSLTLAEKAEDTGALFRKVYVSILGTKQPSLEQWVNRLIEYVDSRYVVAAYQRFLLLVDMGFAPQDAFQEVVNGR